MYKQTIHFCQQLPLFADLFKAADAKGSAQWQIIQWEEIDPLRVRPEDVRGVSELFSNRTEALRQSGTRALASYPCNQNDHYGVWEWQQDGKTMYQCVMPVFSSQSADQQKPKSNDVNRVITETPTSSMVRISEKANAILRRIADADGKTLQAVLDEALQEYDRQRFFNQLNAGYQAVCDDPRAWAEELEERAQSASALMDDIDTDEIWHEDGSVTILERERKSA